VDSFQSPVFSGGHQTIDFLQDKNIAFPQVFGFNTKAGNKFAYASP
jgi:hypothetical protein